MIVKGTRQLGSFSRGINLYVPKNISQGGGAFSPSSIAGLQAFWNLDNNPPNSQTDNSGNGITLSYQESNSSYAASSVAGKVGSAVRFISDPPGDRSLGSRYFTDSWGVDVSNNFSCSVWMKPRSFDAYQHIIGAPFQNGFYIGGNDSNLTFNLFNGTVFGISAPATTFDTWHHYVFIRDGDDLKLYADNVYIGTASVAGQSFTNLPRFSVGGGEFSQYYFDGDIDALGIWNTAITVTDINNLYNDGAGVQMP
jgi:hypothetical protein